MFSDFGTGMERAAVLEKFRREGDLPLEWAAEYPSQAYLACRMAAHDPASRPSSGQILAEMLRDGRLSFCAGGGLDPSTLASAVADLHAQLGGVRFKLREREEETRQLRELLSEFHIAHDHIGSSEGKGDDGVVRIKGC